MTCCGLEFFPKRSVQSSSSVLSSVLGCPGLLGEEWPWVCVCGEGTTPVCVHREELQSVQRELEVLSEQYSQKCLENAHLAQALEAERQALRQCQRENQELNAHNQVGIPALVTVGSVLSHGHAAPSHSSSPPVPRS